MKIVKSREELEALITENLGGEMLRLKSSEYTKGGRGFNVKMFAFCGKPIPEIWSWDKLWLKEVDTTTPLNVGDKVVPFQKTNGRSLEESFVWKDATSKEQEFLYYTGRSALSGMITLNDEMTTYVTGDFFNREDVYLYEEEKLEMTVKEKAEEQVRLAEEALATAQEALKEATKPKRFNVQELTPLNGSGNLLFNNNKQLLRDYTDMYEVYSFVHGQANDYAYFQWEKCELADLEDGDTVYAVEFPYEPSFDEPEMVYKFIGGYVYGIKNNLVIKHGAGCFKQFYKLVRKGDK